MLRLLMDENFSGPVTRGLRKRCPEFDVARVQEVGLMETPDPDILEWAARENRILVTHDAETIPDFAYDRVRQGLPMRGVFEVPDRMAVGKVIEDLVLLIECSREGEWENRVLFLPL
jgi:hypothetical protein